MAGAPTLYSAASQELAYPAWESGFQNRWACLALLLSVVYLLGLCTFPCCRCLLCWSRVGSQVHTPANPPSASSCNLPSSSSSFQFLPQAAFHWQNLVVTGLRLVHRRHRLSVAFKALGEQSSLRQAKGSQPSAARKRVLATRSATPLKEGPILKHGPNEDRA